MYEIDGYEVLIVENVDTGNQVAIVRRHYAFVKKIILSGESQTVVGVTLPIVVKWQDWQGNDLVEETSNIKIIVTGLGQPMEQTLTPVNGQTEFDFESSIAGTFIIQTEADFPCDFAELEVIVNE